MKWQTVTWQGFFVGLAIAAAIIAAFDFVW
jgi:hypothetical protein